jgi:hypothetical protein
MSRARGASQPAAPYRRYPARKLLFECNRRLRDARGPRAFEMMAALIYRSPQVKSGIVHLGDSCIDAGREHCCGHCRREGRRSCEHPHCCMARLMGDRCGKTAHRAKYDLLRAGLVKLHGAGPAERAGGKILDGSGRPVGAATGYELDPELFAAPASTGRSAPGPSRPGVGRHTAATPAAGLAKMRAAIERQRAGP